MEPRRDLTTGSIKQHLWHMALPASMAMFFETMFNVVDTFWAGTVSTTALAALTISFPVFFVIISLMQGLAVAASALAAYHWGRADHDGARHVGAQVLLYAIPATVFLTATGLFFGEPIFVFLGAQSSFLGLALEYTDTVYWGAGLFVFGATLNGLLLAHGDSHTMRRVMIGGFLLNVVLDPWFLYGGLGLPAMGIRGIALATLTVKAVGLIYFAIKAWSNGLIPHARSGNYRLDLSMQKKIFMQAIPASMSMLTIASGVFVTNYFLEPYGKAAIGAFGICMRIEQLFMLPCVGISIAVQAMTGQNYGAARYERIRLVLQRSLASSLTIMTIGACLMLLFPRQLIGIFSDDPQVMAIGKDYLFVAALTSWSYAIMSQTGSVLQGLQRPAIVVLSAAGRQVILRVLAFWLIQEYTDWGLSALWWAVFVLCWSGALFLLTVARAYVSKLSRLENRTAPLPRPPR